MTVDPVWILSRDNAAQLPRMSAKIYQPLEHQYAIKRALGFKVETGFDKCAYNFRLFYVRGCRNAKYWNQAGGVDWPRAIGGISATTSPYSNGRTFRIEKPKPAETSARTISDECVECATLGAPSMPSNKSVKYSRVNGKSNKTMGRVAYCASVTSDCFDNGSLVAINA